MDESISSLDKRIELMRQHMDGMTQVVPWARETGFKVTRVERGQVWGVQPFAEHLVGDVDAQVIHGGAITTLLDNLSGMACAASLEEFRFVATLDLRIDYMKPATPGDDVLAFAECYKLTRRIAFVRGVAYHKKRDEPIANATATFMFTGAPDADTRGNL